MAEIGERSPNRTRRRRGARELLVGPAPAPGGAQIFQCGFQRENAIIRSAEIRKGSLTIPRHQNRIRYFTDAINLAEIAQD
jgi:hypothetical protein